MQNLFDTDNYPDIEPEELKSGDVWNWTRSDITETYPTASYTLKYVFNLYSVTETKQTVTAGKVSSEHVVSVSSDSTALWVPGKYQYFVIIVRDSDSEQKSIGAGLLTVLPAQGEVRSHSRKVLDAIQATIEKTATKEQQSYSIAGRSLSRRTTQELMELEKEYSRRVQNEDKALLRKQGRAKKNNILYKMGGD